MSYLGSWKIDDLLTFPANTHRFDTGAGADADAVPDYRVYEDETAGPLLIGSMALLDGANTVGFYSEQVTLSAANGFEKGKSYTIYVVATVNSVTATMSHTFQIEAEVDANIVSDKTGYSLSSAGVQAIWDALTAALTTAGSIGKFLVDNINSIKSTTDKLDTTMELDGAVYRFTTNALEQAPAGGGGGGTGLINFVYGGDWVLSQQNRITFYLQDSTGVAVTGLGAGFTLTLAKNAAAFGASAGTKAEIGNGWYTYLSTAGEADTIGTVAVKVTGAGAVEQKLEYVVKQRNPGAVEFTYTVTSVTTGLPIEGVELWFATDSGFANIVWNGDTDTFGIARDNNGNKPFLDAGTYYIRLSKTGYTFTDDSEVVS